MCEHHAPPQPREKRATAPGKHYKQAAKSRVLAESSGVAGFVAALPRLAESRVDIY